MSVLSALSYGPMSSKEIAEVTNLSERTVRYALKILKSYGIVKEIFLLKDARKRVYATNLRSEDLEKAIEISSF
nr:helix-turn-helix domain-containing protein [Pyrococcus horikoshii]